MGESLSEAVTDSSEWFKICRTDGWSEGSSKGGVQSIEDGVIKDAGNVYMVFTVEECPVDIVIEEEEFGSRICDLHILDML